MRIAKRFWTLLLCLCMLASFAVQPVFAAVADPDANATMAVDKTEVKVGDTVTVTLSNKLIDVQGFGIYMQFDKNLLECTAITGADGDEYMGLYKTSGKSRWVDANLSDSVEDTNKDGIFSFGVVPGLDTEYEAGVFATLTFTAKAAGDVAIVLNEDTAGTSKFKGVAATETVKITAEAATASPNASIAVDKTEVKVGDTITVTLSNKLIDVQGFGIYMEFDKSLVECTSITGADGDEYMGLYKTSGKSRWVDANLSDSVEDTNKDGIFSFGVVPGLDTEYEAGVFATLTFTAKAAGTAEFVLNEDTAGTSKFKGVAGEATVTITAPAVHVCSGTLTRGQDETCTVDGWKDYYTCSCTKKFADADCTNEITDFEAWKKGAGKIAASHDYGTLVEEDPGKHTATEVKDGMKAHYFCDTCDKYFDSSKVATTKEALTIKNEHNYTAQYGYKEDDGHANVCACGAKDTVTAHTPNITAPTENDDQVCTVCEYVIAPKLGHIHQNNLTPVEKHGATCTEDGYKAHYKCSCLKYFEDASAAVEIADIDAWKTGAGKIAAEGHKYTEQKKDVAHLKTEATKCTEFDVYWYDCSVCDANAKNDPDATDKFWTSTDAGEHKFDEKITDDAHLVAGTGANCQDAKKYYFDCAYCAEIGTTTWTSDSFGDHSFTEKIADAAHLVAGTGANCQDAKEYYYDCAHCATIGTTTWASTEMGDHEFNTAEWGYADKATGHAHKCKFCNEHDAVQPHTPGAPATEDDDQICTTCLIVLEPAIGHICKSHLTKVPANDASCTVDGNIEYYECSCEKYYTDSTASVEITDKTSVVIKAGHNYGTLVDEVPAKHTATELEAGMKAHHFCDKCDTYFTAEKVATTEPDLVIPAPVHEYNTVNGYKEADGHADTCSCGAHNTVDPHTPDRAEATEEHAVLCTECGYEIAPALPHTHRPTNEIKSDKKNHWNQCGCGEKVNVAPHVDADEDKACDVCDRDLTPSVTPETGDNSNVALWISLMVISAFGVAIAVVGKKRYSVK